MKALILVDLQNDFMPGGALAVAEGDQVVAPANRLMDRYKLVVATQDWHPADHGSFAANHEGRQPGEMIRLHGLDQILWPVHCVQGTRGAEFHSDLRTDGITRIFPKGTDPSVDSYSGFFDNGARRSTGLADYLKGEGADSVDVLGLATDYCVRFTALDAVKCGFTTRLIVDACRGVNLKPGDADAAIAEMREAGIQVVREADIIAEG